MASKYSNAMCLSVANYFANHTAKETAQNFGIPQGSVDGLAKRGGSTKKVRYYDTSFKHQVCQYYEHHTGEETAAKFEVSAISIWKWRKELGYRNKHRGYNLYTSQVTPKAVRKNYRMVRSENGDLKAQIMDLQGQIEDLKEINRTHTERMDTFVKAIGGLLQ